MKISLVVVGKAEDLFIKTYSEKYSARLNNYATFDVIETTDEKLAGVVQKFDRTFVLDEKGAEYSSKGFADFMAKQQNSGVQKICFIIGGAYGVPETIKAAATSSISLSQLTFPHQLVRVIFLEQLYRAFTILANEKYHHE
jgi:23S rRNA (pseudouridine1915-N3)-methyltransferase